MKMALPTYETRMSGGNRRNEIVTDVKFNVVENIVRSEYETSLSRDRSGIGHDLRCDVFFYICCFFWVSPKCKHDEEDKAITEWTRIQEIPKSVVFVEAAARARDNHLQCAAKHVCDQLKEEGGDVDGLRSELLQIGTCILIDCAKG